MKNKIGWFIGLLVVAVGVTTIWHGASAKRKYRQACEVAEMLQQLFKADTGFVHVQAKSSTGGYVHLHGTVACSNDVNRLREIVWNKRLPVPVFAFIYPAESGGYEKAPNPSKDAVWYVLPDKRH